MVSIRRTYITLWSLSPSVGNGGSLGRVVHWAKDGYSPSLCSMYWPRIWLFAIYLRCSESLPANIYFLAYTEDLGYDSHLKWRHQIVYNRWCEWLLLSAGLGGEIPTPGTIVSVFAQPLAQWNILIASLLHPLVSKSAFFIKLMIYHDASFLQKARRERTERRRVSSVLQALGQMVAPVRDLRSTLMVSWSSELHSQVTPEN